MLFIYVFYFIFIDLPEPIVILHTQGVEFLEQRINQHYPFKDAILELPEINYASLLFITVLGFTMKKSSIVHIGGYSILSSIIFFFLSNTNCFFFDNANYYGSGISGWTNCLIAGIPFVKNGMVTDLFFSAVLFGSYILFVKSNQKRIIAG